jgi:hypothetical protein
VEKTIFYSDRELFLGRVGGAATANSVDPLRKRCASEMTDHSPQLNSHAALIVNIPFPRYLF